MQPSALALLPPLLVLISAMLTRKLQLSLILGLICGSLIAKQMHLFDSIQLVAARCYAQISDPEQIYVYIFLLCVGILITIINHTGATFVLANYVQSHIKKPHQIEQATFAISLLLALDDYLNCLTAGYIMQPLADKFAISRCKLAYLVHTFAGPLVILIPISTWAAFIISQFDQLGISTTAKPHVKILADPFYVYMSTIPFIFYAILAIFSAFIIIHRSLSFGPMHQAETAAKHELTKTSCPSSIKTQAQLSDLFIPLGTLFACILFGILYRGGYWLLGGSKSLLEAFKSNQDAFFVLGISSIITLIISLLLGLQRKHLAFKDIPILIKQGISLMGSAVMLVILASTLGSILRYDLQTGLYLASILHTMHIMFLPVIFFSVAAITSMMIGTAWGTIALLLPIGLPMAYDLIVSSYETAHIIHFIVPIIGAILAGATFGDHNSPISSALIMASTSSGCKPIDHLQTQLPYTIPAFVGSLAAFFITGILLPYNAWIMLSASLGAGAFITGGLLLLLNSYQKNMNLNK